MPVSPEHPPGAPGSGPLRLRHSWRPRVWLGLLLIGPLAWAKPSSPWKPLEQRRAVISSIQVEVQEVFDLSQPAEDVWFGHLANALHKSTREKVISRALLFQEGAPVKERQIYETERLLRAMAFVKDAHITPEPLKDGTVAAHVRVRDAWTLKVDAGFSSVGGQRTMNFGVQEDNFLGAGKQVAFSLAKDQERRTWGFSYGDPQLFGSRWTLRVANQFLSDGYTRSLALERPFYALDTRWSTSLVASSHKAELLIYDHGNELFRTPYRTDRTQAGAAWALGVQGDRVWRAGLELRSLDTRYGPVTVAPGERPYLPSALPSRRLRGAGLTLATQQDAFESFQDLQGMDTPEDYNLAWTGSLALGSYLQAWGSTGPAPYFELAASKGWSRDERHLALFQGAWKRRQGPAGMAESRLDLSLAQYLKVTDQQILAGYLSLGLAKHPDPEEWYDLGAMDGLRGFPNHLHPGDQRWLASTEYRMLTGRRWWGLFRLGFLVFADVGAIRRLDGQGWSRVYSDLGAGIRLGNLKSTLGRVIQLTVAVPMDRQSGQPGYQIAVGNLLKF